MEGTNHINMESTKSNYMEGTRRFAPALPNLLMRSECKNQNRSVFDVDVDFNIQTA